MATQKNKIELLDIEANYADSMSLLKKKGLQPLTYQEVLTTIDRDKKLKNALKGKWFYLKEHGLELSGYYHFDKKGNLVEGKGSLERTVYVWKGKNPLSLFVHTDYVARISGRRFDLYALNDPQSVASVVLGVRKVLTDKDKCIADERAKERERIVKLIEKYGIERHLSLLGLIAKIEE